MTFRERRRVVGEWPLRRGPGVGTPRHARTPDLLLACFTTDQGALMIDLIEHERARDHNRYARRERAPAEASGGDRGQSGLATNMAN